MEANRKTFVGGALPATSLNSEFDKHVLGIAGDGQCILVKRVGQVVTVSLSIDVLLARIPKANRPGCWFKLVSPRGGSAFGKYNINLLSPPSADVSVNTAAAAADFGAVATPPIAAVAINVQEIANTMWDLDCTGAFTPQIFWGFYIHTNSDGTIVLGFNGDQWENCGGS